MTTINVIIKNIKGKELFLNILETCTINEGKRKLGLTEDVWKFDGIVLNGSKTFKDYGIEDGDIIIDSFNSSNKKPIRVTVKNIRREEFILTILEACTINEGKRKLGLTEDVWKFDGMVLNGNKTFKDYDIEDGDVIISNKMMCGGNSDIY